MRRFALLMIALLMITASATAQKLPKPVKEAQKSIVSIITFKDGVLLRTGQGVYYGDKGDILSSLSFFADADSAVAVSPDGKVRRIEYISGWNSTYDCVKARVKWDKKIVSLDVDSTAVTEGTQLYMTAYGVKKSGEITPVTISKVDNLSQHHYYTLTHALKQHELSLPLVNERGSIAALMQQSARGDTINSYAVSASLIASEKVNAINYNSNAITSVTAIPCMLPEVQSEALTALHVQKLRGNTPELLDRINDYMEMFPDTYDGELLMAEYYASEGNMENAEGYWTAALKKSGKPDDVHYNRAKTLAATATDSTMLGEALCSIDAAIAIERQPFYIQQRGNILFALQKYSDALACYEELATTNLQSIDNIALAADCKERLGDFDGAIMLIDSIVNMNANMAPSVQAPWIIKRAVLNHTAGNYRKAVFDYNSYEKMFAGNLNALFYFTREQAEYNAKMFQQALNDIETALYLEPENTDYLIEKGRLCLRVNMIDEALRTLEKAEKIAPENLDVHYIAGRCHMQKGDKEAARMAFEKAAALSHPDAENMLKKLKEL